MLSLSKHTACSIPDDEDNVSEIGITLTFLLGLNISIIGLVAMPVDSFYLVGELFGLIMVLNVVYAAAFAGLERRTLELGEVWFKLIAT